MSRLFLVAGLLLASLPLQLLAASREAGDPVALVRHLYEVKRAEVALWKAPPDSPTRLAAFAATNAAFQAALSRALAEAFAMDARDSGGGPGRFNADPLLWGQEFDDDVLHDLRVELLLREGGRARVRARFTNRIASPKGPVEVAFELRIQDGQWRISDVRSRGQSLAAILTKRE